MSDLEIINGDPFVYVGHFSRLAYQHLAYDSRKANLTNKEDEVFDITFDAAAITKTSSTKFFAYNRKYGKILIGLQECRPYAEVEQAMKARNTKSIKPNDIIKEWEALRK